MRHCLLIELDALLDTRLGLLESVEEGLSVEVLSRGWQTRKYNDISLFTNKITNEEFQKRWANRTSNILPYSRPTSYLFELNTQVAELEKNIIHDSGRIKDACVIVNLYPYTDLSDEVKEEIINMIIYYVGNIIPVKIAEYPPEMLDLAFFKNNNILTYIVSDYKTWFLKSMAVEKGPTNMVPYPKLTVFCPAVLEDVNALKELTQAEKEQIGTKSPFDMIRIFWAPLFGIHFYPIELFSLIDLSILKDMQPDK